MRKILFIVLGLLIHTISKSQNEYNNYAIGHFVDINKQIINGYFDFDYKPDKFLIVSHTIGAGYSPGHYYNLNGEKIQGLIKTSSSATDYFTFKKSHRDKYIAVKPNECLGYVIGADSFSVINDEVIYELSAFPTLQKGEFVEVIDKFENITFYKRIKTTSANTITTYLAKLDTSEQYIKFPDKRDKFKYTALTIFGDYYQLKKEIQNNKYSAKDIPTLVKLLKYSQFYKQNKKIYFNSAWDEVKKFNDCSYYAEIKSIKDSLYYLKHYFKNDILLFEGGFSSFYPHIKEGKFIWYFPNGNIRKIILYENNKPVEFFTYYETGEIQNECRLSENDDIIYLKAHDKSGNNILDDNGNGLNKVYDPITKRELFFKYRDQIIEHIYYFDSTGNKVYQLSGKTNEFNTTIIKLLNRKIEKKIKYPINSIRNFNHGYILIKCLFESGKVINFEIVKGIDSECDNLILDYLSSDKLAKIWQIAINNQIPLKQEIIIPIEFELKGYSRYKSYSSYFWIWNSNFPIYNPPKLPTINIP